MDIASRPYAIEADLKKIQAATAEWIATDGFGGYLHIGDIALRLFNGMRRYSPSDIVRLWEAANGDLLGWCMLYPRWNSFETAAQPDYHTLTSEIFDWAEREIKVWTFDKPISLQIFEGDQSRISLLQQRGYLRGNLSEFIGVRSLDDPIPNAPLHEGFKVRLIQEESEVDNLVAVMNAAFGWSWAAHDYRLVMSSPGLTLQNQMVIIAPDGRFVAFCYLMFDTVNRLGMFEDVGTHPDFRRLGLGKALLDAGMKHMRQSGMQTALVPYAATPGAASNLYESVGFQPEYQIYNHSKVK